MYLRDLRVGCAAGIPEPLAYTDLYCSSAECATLY